MSRYNINNEYGSTLLYNFRYSTNYSQPEEQRSVCGYRKLLISRTCLLISVAMEEVCSWRYLILQMYISLYSCPTGRVLRFARVIREGSVNKVTTGSFHIPDTIRHETFSKPKSGWHEHEKCMHSPRCANTGMQNHNRA